MSRKRVPKLALVGRPNVGKSALFNRISKKRIAIVDEAEGVTRDRLYADADCFGKPFEVIDTGGINPQSEIPYQEEIRRQAEIAIVEADVIVMVVDITAGVTALDEFVARLLLRTGKPVILAVNKVDDRDKLDQIYPFYSLGISRLVGVSATQGFHIAELLEEAFNGLELPEEDAAEISTTRVAIVGRPNVGKSTIVNYLLDEQRCVVSPIAGTTRDSIDVGIQVGEDHFTLIDTAGIRRKPAEHDAVDKFAAVRTQRALERADVCVLVVDADRGITTQEKRIAREIESQGKGCILLFNKWDLVKGFRMEHCRKSFEIDTPFLNHCPILFVSGLTGRNLDQLFKAVKEVHIQQNRRITTGQLNKFVEKAVQKCHPPMLEGGKRLRIFYLAQVDVQPPRFVLFVNNPNLMSDTYKKYLINQFRESYGFLGSPIQFFLKGRNTKDKNERSAPAPERQVEPLAENEEFVFEEEVFVEDDLSEEEISKLDPSYF
ncbi:MAG: ribosome biogenesis GTPase Der [Verrucomicrobia bacterium]|nr:ribosome biogenesis GTPase Der [Verrucomicrobiota bacterium]